MSFDWRSIKAIIRKDIRQALQNKSVLVPTLLTPALILVLLPAIVVSIPRFVPIEAMSPTDVEPFVRMVSSAGVGGPDMSLLEAWVRGSASYLFAPLFLMVPLMVSTVLAADSFVGERERNTLEGLLYTPISSRDLFVAKVLAAFLPAVLIELLSFAAYALVVNSAGYYAMQRIFFPDAFWWPLVLWLGPGVSLSGIGLTVMISSKAKTFVQAQQWSGVLVLPLVFLLMGQVAGLFVLGSSMVLLTGTAFWAVGVAAVVYGAKTYRRAELISQV